jgi:hypothetical protein
MNAADILKWAEIGIQLINVLGVPIAAVIKLFREAGGTDEQALELIGKWAMLQTTVAARIAFLKAGIAALEG